MPIIVEELEELEPLTAEGLADLERWNAAGRRLRARDPERYKRVLTLARTYLSIYESPEESEDAFEARLRRVLGRGGS